MNLRKISFRPTEEQQPYLEEFARKYNIDNPTELLRRMVDENKGVSHKNGIHADKDNEPEPRSVALQRNGDSPDVTTIRPRGDLSPAGVERDNVDKRPFRRASKQRQKPILMRRQENGDYYVDNVNRQGDSMSTAVEDNELATNVRQLWLQQQQIMWMQYQATMALMNRIQQSLPAYDTQSMPYIPQVGYPMTYSMPQHVPMDPSDICLEIMQKAIRFKNLYDQFRNL